MIALAKYTGWGMKELLDLTEEEITEWFDAALEHKQSCEAR